DAGVDLSVPWRNSRVAYRAASVRTSFPVFRIAHVTFSPKARNGQRRSAEIGPVDEDFADRRREWLRSEARSEGGLAGFRVRWPAPADYTGFRSKGRFQSR